MSCLYHHAPVVFLLRSIVYLAKSWVQSFIAYRQRVCNKAIRLDRTTWHIQCGAYPDRRGYRVVFLAFPPDRGTFPDGRGFVVACRARVFTYRHFQYGRNKLRQVMARLHTLFHFCECGYPFPLFLSDNGVEPSSPNI